MAGPADIVCSSGGCLGGSGGVCLLVVVVFVCWLWWCLFVGCGGVCLLVVVVFVCWLWWCLFVGCDSVCLLAVVAFVWVVLVVCVSEVRTRILLRSNMFESLFSVCFAAVCFERSSLARESVGRSEGQEHQAATSWAGNIKHAMSPG